MTLSAATANKVRMFEAGFVTLLVDILETGTESEKELAVGAIGNISVARETKSKICDQKLLRNLARMILIGNALQCEHAVGTLLNLAVDVRNIQMVGAVDAGVIPALTSALSSKHAKVIEMALCVMANIGGEEDNKRRLLETGFISRIMSMWSECSMRQKEFAVATIGVIFDHESVLQQSLHWILEFRVLESLCVELQGKASDRMLEYAAGCFLILSKHVLLAEEMGRLKIIALLLQLIRDNPKGGCSENAMEALYILSTYQANEIYFQTHNCLHIMVTIFVSEERSANQRSQSGALLNKWLRSRVNSSVWNSIDIKEKLRSFLLAWKEKHDENAQTGVSEQAKQLLAVFQLQDEANEQDSREVLSALAQPSHRTETLRHLAATADCEPFRYSHTHVLSSVGPILLESVCSAEDQSLVLLIVRRVLHSEGFPSDRESSIQTVLRHSLLPFFHRIATTLLTASPSSPSAKTANWALLLNILLTFQALDAEYLRSLMQTDAGNEFLMTLSLLVERSAMQSTEAINTPDGSLLEAGRLIAWLLQKLLQFLCELPKRIGLLNVQCWEVLLELLISGISQHCLSPNNRSHVLMIVLLLQVWERSTLSDDGSAIHSCPTSATHALQLIATHCLLSLQADVRCASASLLIHLCQQPPRRQVLSLLRQLDGLGTALVTALRLRVSIATPASAALNEETEQTGHRQHQYQYQYRTWILHLLVLLLEEDADGIVNKRHDAYHVVEDHGALIREEVLRAGGKTLFRDLLLDIDSTERADAFSLSESPKHVHVRASYGNHMSENAKTTGDDQDSVQRHAQYRPRTLRDALQSVLQYLEEEEEEQEE
jgi:hypothetical protein